MRIFAKKPDDLWGFLEIVHEKSKSLSKPFSFAELMIDHEDFEYLQKWVVSLTENLLTKFLFHSYSKAMADGTMYSNREAFGILFLLFGSEAVRRNGVEGRAWPTIIKHFSPGVTGLLFPSKYPIPELKESIEEGTRKAGLRHLFGVDGMQSWYESIFLQFGFTTRGMINMPIWLCGYSSTVAIYHLLNDSTRGLKSESFVLFWELLRQFRNNNISKEHARKVLLNSPWILDGHIDMLLTEAKNKLNLSMSKSSFYGLERLGTVPFISQPTLHWEYPEKPHFSSQVINLSLLELDEPYYDIMANAEAVGRIIRKSENEYEVPQRITFSGYPERVYLELIDPQGDIITETDLNMWEASGEVNAFEYSSGRRIDPWNDSMDVGKSYLLMVADDLVILPQPERYWKDKEHGFVLYLVQSEWPKDLKILIDDEILWEPASVIQGKTVKKEQEEQPVWLSFVKIEIMTTALGAIEAIKVGQAVAIRLSGISQDIRIKYVRINGTIVTLKRDDKDYIIPEVKLDSRFLLSPMMLVMGCSQKAGPLIRFQFPLNIDVKGGLLTTKEGIIMLNGKEKITVDTLKYNICRVFTPQVKERILNFEDWALMEGRFFAKRLSKGVFPLGEFAGFGAPLVVREGPYNSSAHFTLAREILDTGIIKDVIVKSDDDITHFKIILSHHIEPDEKYRIFLWDQNGHLVIYHHEINTDTRNEWNFDVDLVEFEDFLLGIAYQETRKGAFWKNGAELIEEYIQNVGLIEYALETIRWLRLPVLSIEFKQIVKSIIQKYPEIVLSNWLFPVRSKELGLYCDNMKDEWLSALRTLFLECCFDNEIYRKVITTLMKKFIGANNRQDALIQSLLKLKLIDPLFMASTLLSLQFDSEEDRPTLINQLVTHITTGCPNGFEDSNYIKQEAYWLREASKSMQVDDGFITNGLIKRLVQAFKNSTTLEGDLAENLTVALNVMPFRKYLVLQLLKEVNKKGEVKNCYTLKKSIKSMR